MDRQPRALTDDAWWPLLFGRSPAAGRLRRRALSSTALGLFLIGLLVPLGVGVVVRIVLGMVLAGALAALAVRIAHLYRRAAVRSVDAAVRSLLGQCQTRLGDLGLRARVRRAGPKLGGRVRASLAERRGGSGGLPADLRRTLTASGARARDFAAASACSGAAVLARVGLRVVTPARTARAAALSRWATVDPGVQKPVGPTRQHEVLRLNALGSQLRLRGDHEAAAEQHRAALTIIRDLGDRRAEALTLNGLALALAHGGDEAAAVAHFEQALVILRELGDRSREGRVVANLGFVHRRGGRSEEAQSLLQVALGKLPPGSSAYRRVEHQLRHAS